MRQSIIVDIDGTIADLTHRRPFIVPPADHAPGAPFKKNWAAFNDAMHLDTPIQPTIDLVNTLAAGGWQIILCTGREVCFMGATVAWLDKHGVRFELLLMRPAKDYRDDQIIKREMLAMIRSFGHHPLMAIDDRQRIVDMWRENGLICLQCAAGDF